MINKNFKKKLVFISDIAAPQQIKFCNALQNHFNARFWFYESPERTRGRYWKIELGDFSQIIERVWFRKSGLFEYRYYAPDLSKMLYQFNPDIVMIGGFSRPSNYFAYRWAKRNNKHAVVFTERSRDRKGNIRKFGIYWYIIRFLYRNIDLIIVSDDDIINQFKIEFKFGDKVIAGRYAADLEQYFEHPFRKAKDRYVFLFPNRLIEIYNPIFAVKIFEKIYKKYPKSVMLMNTSGDLLTNVKELITSLQLENNVQFLTELKTWESLYEVYRNSDIMILPAKFSNGNFSILEAMASGMGIVISENILGVGKMIKDGVNGYRCSLDLDEFIIRIENYIQDPILFKKHAEINKNLVEPLSIDGTAKYFFELLYKNLNFNEENS